jgi:hypothetical protein
MTRILRSARPAIFAFTLKMLLNTTFDDNPPRLRTPFFYKT